MLTVLLVVSVLFTHFYNVDGQWLCCDEPRHTFTFLKSAKPDARKAFRAIKAGMNMMPRSNVTMKMLAWAKQYNMTAQMDQYLQKEADGVHQRHEMINTVAKQLPSFLLNIRNIKFDYHLSENAANMELDKLFDSVNRTLADAACCIYSTIRNPNSFRPGPYGSVYYDDYVYIDDYNYMNEADYVPKHYAGFDLSRKRGGNGKR